MAVEDLMREHGILRRALFIFGEAALVLPANPTTVWACGAYPDILTARITADERSQITLFRQQLRARLGRTPVSWPSPSAICPQVRDSRSTRGRDSLSGVALPQIPLK